MDERMEADRVAGRSIARVALVIFGTLVASLALLGWLAYYYNRSHPATNGVYPIPESPRIDAAPNNELKSYLAEQRARLGGYSWVDRDRGLVHIPIERAIEIYADNARKRGAP